MQASYMESKEKAGEMLRLVLPLLAQYNIPADPIHYAVWYEYVSGHNKALSDEIEQLRKGNEAITAETSLVLYRRHLQPTDDRIAERIRGDIHEIMGAVLGKILHSKEQTSHYGDMLASANQHFAGDLSPSNFREVVTELTKATRAMQEMNRQLTKELAHSTTELENLRKELAHVRQQATTDALTGVGNRKGFDESLAKYARLHGADSQSLCLLIADIDHFKNFNDTHGHLVGDRVLSFVAKTITEQVKGQDYVARIGGEEFAVLLPDTPLNGAFILAQKIRNAVATQRLRRSDNQALLGSVTLSVGVARYRPGELLEQFIYRADASLYESKKAGRNRVTVEHQLPAA